MRRFWLALGVSLGALIMWSLTHDARRLWRREEERRRRMAAYDREVYLSLARKSAIDGVDYLDDAYWEQELAQYKDVFDAWERGDFDEYPLD